MASSKKVDLCMFCGVAPCQCNKSTRTPRVPRVKPEPSVVALKADVKPRVLTDKHAAMKASMVQPMTQAEDDDLRKAIRALAPILHIEERLRYLDIIYDQPTVADRREAWKDRVKK